MVRELKLVKTLSDWLPSGTPEAWELNPSLEKKLNKKIIWDSYNYRNINLWDNWPFKHKNIYHWVVLEDFTAVAWNENPSRGRSFPSRKMSELPKTTEFLE